MKRMSWMLGAMVLGAAALTGCSSSEDANAEKTGTTSSRLTVQGSVSNRLGTDNARAVAIAADGKKVWSYLDSHGDFTLKLPVGKSYKVLIANQLPGGGQKVIGKLSLKNGGSKTEWIGAKSGGKVDLGKLTKPADDTSGATAPKCFCDDDFDKGTGKTPSKDEADWGDEGESTEDWGDEKGTGGGYGKDDGDWDDGDWGGGGWDDEGDFDDEKEESDHDDDKPCFGDDEDFGDEDDFEKGAGKELDEDEICDVCTDGKVVDLEPSKKDAGDWGDVDAKETNGPETKVCPKKADVEAKGTAEEKTSTSEAKPGEIQSKKSVGDKCSVKNECGDSVCVASKCAAK